MLAPRLVELAREKQHVREVVVGERVLGRERDRLAVMRDRLLQVAGRVLVQQSEVVMRFRRSRLDRERLGESVRRRREVAQRMLAVAEVHPCRREARVE
jgi:hypothetical protein